MLIGNNVSDMEDTSRVWLNTGKKEFEFRQCFRSKLTEFNLLLDLEPKKKEIKCGVKMSDF